MREEREKSRLLEQTFDGTPEHCITINPHSTKNKPEVFSPKNTNKNTLLTLALTSYLVTPAGIFRPFTVIACVTLYCLNSSGLIIPNCNFLIRRNRAVE
jgi:hypothetical protein